MNLESWSGTIVVYLWKENPVADQGWQIKDDGATAGEPRGNPATGAKPYWTSYHQEGGTLRPKSVRDVGEAYTSHPSDHITVTSCSAHPDWNHFSP